MRILHIIDGLSMGGAENLLLGLAGEQVLKGNYVTVSPLVCADRTILRDKMEAKGIVVKPFKTSGSVYNPFFIFRIIKVIRRYDLVHVHLFPALYWVGFAHILFFCRVPMVYTEHSTNNKRRKNKLLHAVDRFVYKHGYKKIIGCADVVLKKFNEAFPTLSHVCSISNGIDIGIFKNAKPYTKHELLGIDESAFIVTMVARFMPMKRQDTIVEAISKLPEKIHAVFVGGEEQDEGLIKIRQLAAELEVSDRIHFLHVRNDVPRILKTSDVVIMASDYEGLSLSSIEGMAVGKPFIASDVDGLRDVVIEAGVLFENKNSDMLANIILTLYSDKSEYEKIANQCFERANRFDISLVADDYLKIYRDVLE